MNEFLQSYLANMLNYTVYAAIAVLFIVTVIKCVMPVIGTKGVLNSATRQIKKGEAAKRTWQDEAFLGKGALRPHWGEYLNNLFFADGEFHNPSSVEDYINEDTAIYGPGRSTLGEAMPGLMVSLGFLGTLIGMVQGMSGFNMADSTAVMNSITTLIPGMRYAFVTSIVGVIASICATLLIRIVNGSAIRALNNFYIAISKHAGVQSVDPMTQIAIYQQEQTALIQAMAEDITGGMTDRIATAIEKSLQPVRRSLDEFISFTTRDQMRGVDMMVQRFMQAMNESLSTQFARLAQTIDATCQNQTQMQQGIRQTVDALTGMSQDLMQVQRISEGIFTKFDGYMDKLNGSYQMVDEGYARIAANVEHLEIIARQQNGYLQSVGKLQNEIVRAMDNFQNASNAFMASFSTNIEATKNSLGDVSGSLSGVTAEMKRSSDTLADNHKKLLGGITKDIDKTYNTFFAGVEKATSQLSWTVEDIKNNIAKLPDLIDGTAGLYANQADRLTDALRRAQAALDDAVDRLNGR
ncbi:MotA/TolQ/ExbB proton channel family protein [Eubacteriales bacterium OttesenSCG-928-N13]|nr:MotA/TolQ/ExbB proton channel family protein [Eubacteriales bacterium OttesenSCG-928-N13]